jgi:hypothetical protein
MEVGQGPNWGRSANRRKVTLCFITYYLYVISPVCMKLLRCCTCRQPRSYCPRSHEEENSSSLHPKVKLRLWVSSAIYTASWREATLFVTSKWNDLIISITKFAFYRKLVKNTITSDRFRWLTSTDNLLSQSQYFGNTYVLSENIAPLEVDGAHLDEGSAVCRRFS